MAGAVHMWRLRAADDCARGLVCDEHGLRLAGAALIEQRAEGYVTRPRPELTRLFAAAYDGKIEGARIASGLDVVSRALNAGNHALARIAAVQLRLPELSDPLARVALLLQDAALLLERRHADALLRWDADEHPRTGTPPNPGWFAPSGDGGSEQIAQEEDRPEGEESNGDALGPVRQALWNEQIAALRALDPKNPNLTYFANPNSSPSQAALDRLTNIVRRVATQRVLDHVMPYGKPIGQEGSSPDVREVRGGLDGAQRMFDYLSVGGTLGVRNADTMVGTLAGGAGHVTFRARSSDGSPAVNVYVPGVPFTTIHFPARR